VIEELDAFFSSPWISTQLPPLSMVQLHDLTTKSLPLSVAPGVPLAALLSMDAELLSMGAELSATDGCDISAGDGSVAFLGMSSSRHTNRTPDITPM
jgi:hypothetical protein